MPWIHRGTAATTRGALTAVATLLAAWACEQDQVPTAPPAHPLGQLVAIDTQPFYYFYKEKIYLRPDPTRLVVTTTTPLSSAEAARQAVAAIGAPLGIAVNSVEPVGYPPHWVLHLQAGTSLAMATAMRARLQADRRFRFVSHAYRTVDKNTNVLLLDHVVARFKDNVSPAQVDSIARALGARVLQPPVADSGYRSYVLSSDSAGDVLHVANAINQSPLARWASPDMIGAEVPFSVPTDPYYSLQYYFKNSLYHGGIGADINVERAWDLTKGDPSIRITFIGTGVDSHHPEFVSRSMTGYDAMWNDPDIQPGEWAGHPANNDGHETAVAGIAVALHDGRGTVGVAPNVQYDAVRIFRLTKTASHYDIAKGITWAYQRSDILNNSWGACGSPDSIIADAVADALLYGRGGKGAVVVFSAGNRDTTGGNGCTSTQNWES